MSERKKDSQNFPTRRRRWIAVAALFLLVGLAVVLARPIYHLVATAWQDVDETQPPPPNVVDDASRLNRTRVEEVWPIPDDREAAEDQLARLLKRARAENLRVSIAGAKHSMGGHTMYPGGIVVSMLPFDHMELDKSENRLHVQAGALWEDVIPYLDQRRLSIAVMQASNSFSVGGSLSVNCHGWQYGAPPIASTVERFRLMQADGTIVECSRTKNEELFSLAIGGYGLFGIILDADLRVVPNERYRLEQFIVPVDEGLQTFDEKVKSKSGVAMVYARMNVAQEQFLEEAVINVFYRDPAPDGTIPDLHDPRLVKLRRTIFRGSVGSEYGKELRWQAETELQPLLRGEHFSRNQLLNEGVEVFQNRSEETTDILHEYFVPREGIAQFVQAVQRIVAEHDGDLLNVTVRYVDTDEDTFLRYADDPVFALVMLFNQRRTEAGEARMKAMTQELIEAALQAGGSYYLPYRLHATREQFRRAYPQAERFFALKRRYDPGEMFQNRFYLKYGQRK